MIWHSFCPDRHRETLTIMKRLILLLVALTVSVNLSAQYNGYYSPYPQEPYPGYYAYGYVPFDYETGLMIYGSRYRKAASQTYWGLAAMTFGPATGIAMPISGKAILRSIPL